jgi:hypothetical protein
VGTSSFGLRRHWISEPSGGLKAAIAAISRASKLASQLLALLGASRSHEVIDLGRLIRGIDDMLRRALGDSVEIETIISGGLRYTFVGTAQVGNALSNLAINARDRWRGTASSRSRPQTRFSTTTTRRVTLRQASR